MKTATTTDNENPLCECANCGLRNAANDLSPCHDIWSRLTPGDTMPHGDCPECGASCFPVKEPSTELPSAVIYSVTSDTASGMNTELFGTQKLQLERIHELMSEDADDIGEPLPNIGSPEWWQRWEDWREMKSLDNDYFSWDEHTVTLGRSHPPPMRAAESKIIEIAKRFPALQHHVENLTSWDIDRFMEWLPRASTGERHAMLFIASVWNPRYALEMEWRFNIVVAAGEWDQQHHNAFLAWAMKPEWP